MPHWFPEWLYCYTFQLTTYERYSFTNIFISTWFNLLVIFLNVHFNRSIELFHFGFNLHFPNNKWYSTSFCVLVIHVTTSIKCLLKSSAHFILCVFPYWLFSLVIDFRMFFIYSNNRSLIGYVIWKYFLLICDLYFHYLNNVFHWESFKFWWCPGYWYVSFMDCALGAMPKKSSLT